MKHTLFTYLLAAGCCLPMLQANAKVGDILPIPHVVNTPTHAKPFMLNREVALISDIPCVALQRFLTTNGCKLNASAIAQIRVQKVESIAGAYDYSLPAFDNEAYQLSISENEIIIKAVTPTGVIRAAQTLTQIAEGYDAMGETAQLEAVNITDWPAFKVRGWMQDVGRSFLSIDELKKEIELLSRFKVNVFHWHLTEKLAWRFEVKSYPALTQAENMIRYKGQYYTQEQCRELEAYAAQQGVTIIPEIDMPGHSDVFTHTMGFDMQSQQGRAALKVILKEVAATFPKAPYIHIGGDEVALQDGFLEEMASFVRNELSRKVVVWNPLMNKGVNKQMADMTQMWSTRGNKIAGLPNIDCRYNYTNHFDVYADLVGIYKSSIYYTDKGNSEVAGTISAAWNDTKTATETDIIRQNNQYANIIASASRAWQGGGKRYIEAGGTTLPNTGEEFDDFANFEQRFLFHKAHSLKEQPIPYVKQSNVHWRITDPFPNNGDASKVFPPETSTDTLLATTFNYQGINYRTHFATGAGIYLRHIWHPTVPSFFSNPANNQTAYAWTYVYSPQAQDVGAQIEFYTYSRSGNEKGPKAGQWDRRGSRIWLNDNEIPAPTWQQPDKDIKQDDAVIGLTNENFTAREPVALHLNQGWNKVFIKLPHANNGGTARDKWQFTFVITDTEGRNAVEGLIYSPDKSLTDDIPQDENLPKLSNTKATHWYRFSSKRSPQLFPNASGAGQAIVSTSSHTTATSEWMFADRGDGTFNIVNRANGLFISPITTYNAPLITSATVPTTGWQFKPAATDGFYILVNGNNEINQTKSSQGFKLYNWGYGSLTPGEYRLDDDGCQFSFTLSETTVPTAIASPTSDAKAEVKVVNGRIVTSLPYRLYSTNGRSLPIGRQLTTGSYIVRTAQGNVKVVVR